MDDSTPICRCRVLYLGSSVPQQTKDGLQGIQEPLQELYPDQGATGAKGIDSWLSVWSNGILLENVDENHKKVTRFFPIESLHYCAAVRYVLVPEKSTLNAPSPRFLPLDSPFARAPNPTHPPLFAAILRRTTGIKVLECHAFICKREVAANALVRCCFHAYADSSYAKQVDTAGSLYGTLASERLTSKEKINEWKHMNSNRSQSGSTMTINTIGKDDVSIYNGDENHKVWAGSEDHLDGPIYDVYASSTISRPSRPRQIAQPVPVPPPPVKEKKKKSKTLSKSLAGSREDLYHPIMNGKASSISGTLMRPRHMPHQMSVPPGPHPHHQQPIYIVGPPPPMGMGTLPNPKFFKHGTFSHRPRGKMLIPARPIPPPMVPMMANGGPPLPPMGPHPMGPMGQHMGPMGPMGPHMGPIILPPPTTLTKNKKKHHRSQPVLVDEPIYMGNGRAMSPPVNFSPHEAAYMMQQQYATMEREVKPKHRSREKSMEKQGKINKKLAQSMNGLDDPNLVSDESPFNTGIYRKKGHLNERAFSYSIRQEHRSRSYGSLANLKFATPIPNGHDIEDREDFKKEREIMQMVQDLDLSGDELERSEVPRGMYEPRPLPPGPVIVTGAQINGRGHRR